MIYSLDSIIHAMNNWALMDRKTCWLPCRVLLLTLIIIKVGKTVKPQENMTPTEWQETFLRVFFGRLAVFLFYSVSQSYQILRHWFYKNLNHFPPMPHNSYNVSSENFVSDQVIIPKLIFFLYSHHLSVWYCFDGVGRNSVLVIHGGKKNI